MQNPVKERIAKLREEKVRIREANGRYVQSGKKMHGAAGIMNADFKGCRQSSMN
ncbi:MAG: hypothetical protein ABSF15_21385 [Candidatus Sulfotelmatobacter sp.]|jgi:hypothetical protein